MVAEEKTNVLEGHENILKFTLDRLGKTQKKLDACYNHLGPPRLIKQEPIKQACLRLGERAVNIRYLTDITKGNLSYCKEILQIKHLQMRHIDTVKGNFVVEDDEGTYIVAHAIEKEEEPARHAIYSTVKGVVEVQQYLFDSVWTNAIPADYRIKELEEGVVPSIVEIIRDPHEIQRIAFDLIKSAKDEILIMFSMPSSFLRQEKIGSMDLLLGAALVRKVKVKILTSVNEEIKDWQNKIEHTEEIEIRNIEPLLQTRMTILVVDKKFSIVTEITDESDGTSIKAMGLASYSTSRLTVLGYASIFEALWKQSELYQKVTRLYDEEKISNIRQREFITIVAHELRNPIQPIIGLAEVLRARMGSGRRAKDSTAEDGMLDIIARNAKRLQNLTEDILDITRIETNTLKLKKEKFSLKNVINTVVQDYQNEIRKTGKLIELISSYDAVIQSANNLMIVADQTRIYQVISNLINNAIKYTDEGLISVISTITSKDGSDKYVNVSVKDSGVGIDPEILPQLFNKFTTKSNEGTGLGLFICRNIVEAHNGRIRAENNSYGVGATFSFTLPLHDVFSLVEDIQKAIKDHE